MRRAVATVDLGMLTSHAGRGPSLLVRWLAAFAVFLAALAISLLLRDFLSRTIFVFFFFAIAFTAWYSGLAPGLVITALSLVATNYYLVEPYGTFTLNSNTLVAFIALGGTAVFINWLTNSLETARTELALHAEQVEEQTRELEAQMEQRQMLTEELETTDTQLGEAIQKAQAANRAKTDFLAVMSHELRTPLNAIVGYADLLQTEVSGPLTDTQKTHLARIHSSSFHLLDLIQDVLSFSRIEAGREELRVADVDVQQLARDANAYIEHQCAEKGLQQELQLPQERIVMVTDPAKVRQILLNLLNNACQFADTGFVRLTVHREDDHMFFRVEDSGPGIAPQHLE